MTTTLIAPPSSCALDRRQFLGAAPGLTLALVLPAGTARAATATPVNAWLSIGSEGGGHGEFSLTAPRRPA